MYNLSIRIEKKKKNSQLNNFNRCIRISKYNFKLRFNVSLCNTLMNSSLHAQRGRKREREIKRSGSKEEINEHRSKGMANRKDLRKEYRALNDSPG